MSPTATPAKPAKPKSPPADFSIPPRPDVITVLFDERRSESPDLKRVARHIMADAGLSAGMLKAVNSPAFGLARKVTGISAAVDLLGMKNVCAIATGLALRSITRGRTPPMERFWDTAEKTALLCAHLAGKLKAIPRDEAYTYGLLHDCGIPLLLQRYPNYKDTLAKANSAETQGFTAVEEADIGTNHAAICYFMAKSWFLPEEISHAVLHHHDLDALEATGPVSDVARNYIALGHLAGHIHHMSQRASPDYEWGKFRGDVLRHFGLDDEDLTVLIEDAQTFLQTGA
ncbi:MAG TPA: HDOD domain-containing protein [Rhodocyclaceae bacterium]